MASYREFMNDYLANCKCRGELKAKSDAEVLVTKLCEKLDEMGGGGIKTVVIKGVLDKTMGRMVYTPNMTYEEARDMLLNLEPFNVVWIEGDPLTYEVYWISVQMVRYDYKHNKIALILSDYVDRYDWTAGGIVIAPK